MRRRLAAPIAALVALALLMNGCQGSGELIGRTIVVSDEATLSEPNGSRDLADLAAGRERILLNF